MNKGLLIGGILGAIGLGAIVMGKKNLYEEFPTPTISQAQGIATAKTINETFQRTNYLLNQATTQAQYDQILNIEKQLASIGLQNAKDSGFMGISEGFSNLANSLGIVIK